ncbi:MAG: acetyl-CoA C-acyltransferase [Flavobacteriales bacterium]
MDAFIIDGVRTPIGNFGGSLAPIRTDDLASMPLKRILDQHPNLDPTLIGDVILGCANQAGEDNRNVGRMASLLAGIPPSVPGVTINRLCASGMGAAIHAARMVHCQDAGYVLAGGVEHMTRGPWVISKASSPFGRDSEMFDTSFGWRFINPRLEALYGVDGMGQTAENLVDQYGISREDQDRFAAWSQNKAASSQALRAEEMMEVRIPRRKQEDLVFAEDEFIKPNTSAEVLAKLRPAFRAEGGSVTAGNSSGLNDGAASLLIANESGIKRASLNPMTQILSSAVVGVEPRIMGIGPVEASRRALEKANLSMDDMDLIELNEAFAAQSLACIRAWGLDDLDVRINPRGGAIALGHPLGMTGARLLLTASKQLIRSNKKYALVTLCVGVGQGYAAVLRNARI